MRPRGHRYAGTLAGRDTARHLKLAQLLPEANLPVVSAPQASAGTSGGLARFGTALQQSARALAVTQARIAQAEEAKRKQLATQEAKAAEAAVSNALSLYLEDLQVTEADPDAFEQKFMAEARRVTQDSIRGLRTDDGKADAAQRFQNVVGEKSIVARRRSNLLRRRQGLGLVESTVANVLQEASRTHPGDQETFDRLKAMGEKALRAALPWYERGEEELGELERAFRDALDTEQALQHRKLDPEGFVENAAVKYPNIATPRRDEMIDKTRRAVDQKKRDDRVAFNEWLARVEKADEAERQQQLIGLSAMADRGELTMAVVNQWRTMGRFHSTKEYEHYRTLATTTAKEAPSDVVTWSRVQEDVWSGAPSMSATQIRALMQQHRQGQPGLSGEHGRMALSELARTSESRKDESRSLRTEAYHLAKTEGRTLLGVTTPMTVLDGPAAAIVGAFEQEFNAQVLDADGNPKAGARDTLYQILPRFIDIQSSEARRSYDDQSKLIGAGLKTTIPDADSVQWLQWWRRTHQQTEALRTTNPNLYTLRRQQLQRLLRDRAEILRTMQQATILKSKQGSGVYVPPTGVK